MGIKSLNDPIDTTTAQGRLIFNIFASLAEFEREIIRERTIAGLEAARARGRLGGRPKGLTREGEKTAIAAASLYQENYRISDILSKLEISKSTLYKYLRLKSIQINSHGRK
jgi:DNA invertase Pin-like site-specific DNA recombinase